MFTLILSVATAVSTIGEARTTSPRAVPAGHPATFLWADWDGDGLDDAFIVTPGGEAHLMRNRRDGTFEDAGAEAGLGALRDVTAAAWGDIDADGRLDLFVSQASGEGQFYRAVGRGSFELAAIAVKHEHAARFAHFQDYDRDGLLDLHVHTDAGDLLFHNRGATSFERVELPLVATGEAAGTLALDGGRSDADAIGRERSLSERDLSSARGVAAASDRGASTGERGTGDHSIVRPSRDGDGGVGATSGGGTGHVPGGPHGPDRSSCASAPAVQDQASSSCIQASTTPTLGLLYPLSTHLNVDASGRVGMGTTTPLYKLHVTEATATGVFGQGGTHGVRGDANLAGAGNRYGGYFTSSGGSNNIGVYGASTIGTFGAGTAYGAYGESNASTGVGVYGKSNHASGATIGAIGESVSSAGIGVDGRATATSGSTVGVRGSSSSPSGAGVQGSNSAATGNPIGVLGAATVSATGTGVYGTGKYEGVHGVATATSGNGFGVYGESAVGSGVSGHHFGTTGSGFGVSGYSASTTGTGVLGSASAASGQTYGVRGTASSSDSLAAGVRGEATGSGAGVSGHLTSGSGAGVKGTTSSQTAAGVRGDNTHAFTSASTDFAAGVRGGANGGMGVVGLTKRSSALQDGLSGVVGTFSASGTAALLPNSGVSGSTDEASGAGVYGYATSGVGVWGEHGSTSGTTPGVRGETMSTEHLAVALEGRTTDSVAADRIAVRGISNPAPYYGYGGYFESGYIGVVGFAEGAGTGERLGAYFDAQGGVSSNVGVQATATGTSASGVVAGAVGAGAIGGDFDATGTNAVGGQFSATGTGSRAGYFAGNTHVQGTLSKSGGSFKIDHPLDPEHKTLSHSFVESPDMMNIYNGNAALDARGEAWVEMPSWFDALNKDFRYQLTAIGAPAPMLHVAVPMTSRRFQIAGGAPHGQVSWQVTGVRKDPWAEMNRIPVEELKPPAEQGLYYNPESYGLDAERGIGRALRLERIGGRARVEAAKKVLRERDASVAAPGSAASRAQASDRSKVVRVQPASHDDSPEPRAKDE